jgi:iron complex transport system substrate-binding protein
MNRISLLLITCIIIGGCNGRKVSFHDSGIVEKYTENTTFFAKGFSLKADGRNTVLIVRNPWQHANGVEFNYILSDTVASSEKINEYSWLIKTPVRNVICLSTTHIGFIEYINEIGSVSGISGKAYIVNNVIRKGIKDGLIADVGYDENLNYELILKLEPDLVFAYGVSVAITNTVKKLNEFGIPVILIGEYLEQEPLAKMEWVKVFAACYGQQVKVAQKFDSTVTRYKGLVKLAADVKSRPTVLLGLPWRGNWYISGSRSYIARLVKDAGGKYIWDHLDFNESRPIGLEKIYEKALVADLWLNPGEALSKKDILSADERFGNLLSFKNDKVFNNNNMLVETGGNAFYESGVIEPDIILSDLIYILHPQLLPSYRLKYYRKLP